MKIAFIWCGAVVAGWSAGDGLCNALRKAGHEILPIPRSRPTCPLVTAEALNIADAIIVSGPEHIFESHVKGTQPNHYSFGKEEISLYDWKHNVKPPKIFMYHESNRREDRTFGFEDYLSYADYHFFPAIQDAETYDQEHFAKGRSFWLPFGVDTDVFRPVTCMVCKAGVTKFSCKYCLGSGFQPSAKDIDVGFIGMMYPKRNQYITSLSQHWKAGRDPEIICGKVHVVDIDGFPWTDQVNRLAMNYRRLKVFFNLPAYSELLVSKVVEVMACGTFILTPMLDGVAEANCVFQHAKELAYYHPNNLPFVVQTLREFAERDEIRERIATAGMNLVHEKFSLKVQIKEIFEKCKLGQKKELVQ